VQKRQAARPTRRPVRREEEEAVET